MAFKDWVKEIWVDILTMLAVGGATLGIYMGPNLNLQRFPLTYAPGSDDGSAASKILVDPSIAYPYRGTGWLLAPWLSAVVSIGPGILAILLSQIRVRSVRDTTNGVLGLLYGVLFAATTHTLLKQLIGGFRPYFLAVCQPEIPLSAEDAASGEGYDRLYFSTSICKTEDRKLLKQATTSFPSGHAAVATAGLGFAALYLNGKLKPFGPRRPPVWRLVAVLAPLVMGALVSCTVLVDAAHHCRDVVAGVLVGVLAALVAYRMNYAAVWDWRFSHVPLRPGPHDFDYRDFGCAKREGMLVERTGVWATNNNRGADDEQDDGGSEKSRDDVSGETGLVVRQVALQRNDETIAISNEDELWSRSSHQVRRLESCSQVV